MQAYAIMDMRSFSVITNRVTGRLCIFETEPLAEYFMVNNIEDCVGLSVEPITVDYVCMGVHY